MSFLYSLVSYAIHCGTVLLEVKDELIEVTWKKYFYYSPSFDNYFSIAPVGTHSEEVVVFGGLGCTLVESLGADKQIVGNELFHLKMCCILDTVVFVALNNFQEGSMCIWYNSPSLLVGYFVPLAVVAVAVASVAISYADHMVAWWAPWKIL